MEHSGFKLLTSTMRMSRATNCANALVVLGNRREEKRKSR